MRTQMIMALQNYEKCKIYEKKDPKAPLCTVAAIEPMDLVHFDLVGMEVTVETKKKPVVQKILVVTDHFSRFVQAYKVKDKRAIMAAWAEGMLCSFVTCAHMLLHPCSMWKQLFIVHSNDRHRCVRKWLFTDGWFCTT